MCDFNEASREAESQLTVLNIPSHAHQHKIYGHLSNGPGIPLFTQTVLLV